MPNTQTPAQRAAHALFNSDAAIVLDAHDTGQLDVVQLDTGQAIDACALMAYATPPADEQLAVTFHEIHRYDPVEGGGRELITSTLKYFTLHIAVQDAHGELLFHRDGTALVASLVYESGEAVEALSATLEPPLLAAAGEKNPKAIVEGGCASFKLRITVLSSLCGKQNFRVRVLSEEHPELACVTAATKTITKLRRGVREPAGGKGGNASLAKTIKKHATPLAEENGAAVAAAGGAACGSKRALSLVNDEYACVQGVASCEQGVAPCEMDEADEADPYGLAESLASHTLDELWDQVSLNGARLLELQAQQRTLFKELRALKEAE